MRAGSASVLGGGETKEKSDWGGCRGVDVVSRLSTASPRRKSHISAASARPTQIMAQPTARPTTAILRSGGCVEDKVGAKGRSIHRTGGTVVGVGLHVLHLAHHAHSTNHLAPSLMSAGRVGLQSGRYGWGLICATLPKTTCLPFRCWASSRVMKNWELFVFGPLLAMLKRPGSSWSMRRPAGSSSNLGP
jgi:hypothetical protein